MKNKKHILVIEMEGFRTEIEIDKPFSKDNPEINMHVAEQVQYGIHGALKPATKEPYRGWAKLEIFVGGYTEHVNDEGHEDWNDDCWETL